MARSAESVAEGIRQDVFAGKLRPGDPLREMSLVERYEVSRRTIREALLDLAAEGLVAHRHNAGAVVRPFTREDVRDLYRVRRMLECEGSRAAVSASESMLADVERNFLALEEAVAKGSSGAEIARADMSFHGAVIALSGSPRIDAFYRTISLQMTYAIGLLQADDAVQEVVPATVVAEHRSICQSILNRDVVEAQRFILQHIAKNEHVLLELAEANDHPNNHGLATA